MKEQRHATTTGRQLRAAEAVRRAVRDVRRRWRLKLVLRGATVVAAASLLLFVVSATSLELLRFHPQAVNALRVVLWLATVGLLARFVLWPLLRRVSDERVALYLEEHEPALQSRVLAAVESSAKGRLASSELDHAIVDRAARECRRLRFGAGIERSALRRAGGALAGVLALAAVLFLAGPGFFRHGAPALLFPARAAEAVNPYRVAVQPGDTTISRNSDLRVSAVLHGFDAGDVVLYTEGEGGGGFSAMPMIGDGAGAFDGLLLNVAEPTRYYVEANGVRSATFALDVADLPAIDQLRMEYHFPAYTGLAPRRFEHGGDVAALAGTTVKLVATSTLPSSGAVLSADWGDTIPMTPRPAALPEGAPAPLVGSDSGGPAPEGASTPLGGSTGADPAPDAAPLAGSSGPGPAAAANPDSGTSSAGPATAFEASFVVRRDGFYGIRLQTAEGAWVAGAPDYRVDVLEDQGPSISFSKPGRDAEASSIEEVFVEARADDDIGVAEVLWVYSVNGGAPDTVRIHAATGPPLAEVTAGHTVFMEELGLEVGDLVAYHGVARDNAPVPNEALTDIYFLQVRPFRRDFRESQGGGGGGSAGGGEGSMEDDLSGLQRQIIAASFNLVRDRDTYDADAWEENVVSVALSQQRLREQAATLAQRIVNRGISGADESFRRIAEALPRAVEAMREAEDSLRALSPGGAIGPEQRSLRELQRAEETYERFVSLDGGPQGGGGGRGGGPSAEDLADLFELETDKLRNQYEAVQRSRRQTADQGVDESLEKLRELARRQEQELERQRRRAAAQQGGTGAGGGDAARALAEQAEEAARQLERLSRETGDPSLEDVSRQLEQAANAMRRAAASRGTEGVAEAQSALRRLRDARERLEGVQDERVERQVDEARRRAADLAEQQRDVENRLEAMRRAGRSSADQIGRIRRTKEEMAEEAGEILGGLERAANDARREGRQGASELEEAVETIRETQLRERLRYSRGLVGRPGQEDYAQAFENQTAQAIQSLRNRLDEAAEAVRAGAQRAPEAEALEAARDLVRSLESMERRTGRGDGERAGEGADPQSRSGEAGAAEGANRSGGAPGGGGGGANDGRDVTQGRLAPPRAAGPGRPFTGEEVRQMRREVRERAGELRGLGELIERAGASAEELAGMIAAMRALDRDRTYDDPAEALRLRAELLESMKQLEFRLRREFAADGEEQLLLQRSGDVPAEYRALVEEYYRELSRSGARNR